MTQPLSLPGSLNLRDLGGVRTHDGAIVRSGRLYRSEFPAFLTRGPAADELGLRTVLDLRRTVEAGAESIDAAAIGVDYHRCPLVAGKADSWHAKYPSYLHNAPDRLVAAVRIAVDPDRHPVLFHCAAGKDRTGVLAALLLGLLDVPRDQIVADYTATEQAVVRILARLQGIEYYRTLLNGDTVADQWPAAANIESLLDWLDARGGTQQWLLDHGLPGELIVSFREAMLSPASAP